MAGTGPRRPRRQPATATAAARLEELRLTATEDRIDAELAAGRHTGLVAELEALVAEHPLRERLRGQLMLALYRSGRQADALEAFHTARRVLTDELGLDPGPELTRLHEALLRHEDRTPPDRAPTPRGARPPTALTSFVGRDDELDRVVALLDGCRLVTLTGPGGVGKTRLAAEAATRATRRGVGTVWFVELASTPDPARVPDTIATALGLTEEVGATAVGGDGRDPIGRVADALRGHAALLVLDNCEHVVEVAAGTVRDLLATTDDLTVLCTSREALGITGETVWSVPSLGPDAAVALFVDRARAGDPSFAADVGANATIVEVCRRLDGIPLAIELAAARIRTLGLDELAARLDDRFRVLTGGDRTAQPRQRTLRAVVDWSWELLDEVDRALFRRLAVFAAGATLDAAEAVCADPDLLPTDEVLDRLTGLVDRSLVVVDRDVRPTRFRMLETLREYAADRLAEAGEHDAVAARHAAHLEASVLATVPELRTAGQLAAMARLDAELDDLRAALRWCQQAGEVARGARLAVELGWYWYLRGHRAEGLTWLATAAADGAPREAALARLWQAFLQVEALDRDGGHEQLLAAIATVREHGDAADRAFAELVGAELGAVLGHHDRVPDHVAAAIAAADEADDEGYRATARFVAGHTALLAGRPTDGLAEITDALDRFVAVGDRWGQVQCRLVLSAVAEAGGEPDAALAHADASLMLAAELRLRELEGILHARRAAFLVTLGELRAASEAIAAADDVVDELGSAFLRANVDLAAGAVALAAEQLDVADRRLRAARAWLVDTPHPELLAHADAQLAAITARRHGGTDDHD